MANPMANSKQDGVEHGYTLCRHSDGTLVHGPEASGHRYGVNIDISCPHGSKPHGLFHTHPGGSSTPSDADLREARRIGVEHLCIGVPETGEVRCHRIIRKR